MKLIDLDGTVSFSKGEGAGLKFSSAYLPPEMIWQFPDGTFAVRSSDSHANDETGQFVVSLLTAHPSFDIWALGCVVYLLCTGSTLFQATVNDHMSNESDYFVLHLWTDETKTKKLSLIRNKIARNFVSMLLNKDPEKRPSARRLLQHPYFTGKTVTRLVGDDAKWDVFLSYRSDADEEIARMIHKTLTESGIRVWWDKVCLLPGQNWEVGFCSGLVDSANFVCILSREGIKNPNDPRMNWEVLENDSNCDNLFLECRLALELRERGLINGIFPVMIGDKDSHGKYSNYFKGKCKPDAPKVCVNLVESKLREHLDRESLGYPYRERGTVHAVLQDILSNQGKFIEGDLRYAIEDVCSSIRMMVQFFNKVSVIHAR